MKQFLISIHHSNNYETSSETPKMAREIDLLNEEMVKAGIRIFVGGFLPSAPTKSLRLSSSGEVRVADGPYLKGDEHVGGFWVLKLASIEEAVEWGRKAAVACRAPVEVREFANPPAR